MNSNRKRAIVIGLLFIAATVFSILGLASYGPILNNPDYITAGPTSANQIVLGAVFELIAVAAIAGTAIAFFPILRKRNESVALGYVGFRLLEAVGLVIGLVSLLTLLALRQSYVGGTVVDVPSLQTADALLRSVHAWAFIIGPNFIFAINTLLYSYLLYQMRIVPRTIAVLGLVGAVLIFVAALLELFGVIAQVSVQGLVLALPVGVYEMILAVFLIAKGFRSSATIFASVRTESNEPLPAYIE
jgi:hypothetical protein